MRRGAGALADLLAIIDADHHDDEFRFVGSDDLLDDLGPFNVTARIVADEPRGRAMLSQDGEFRLFGKSLFEAVGQPIRHAVADDHDRIGGRGVRFLLRPGRVRVIRGCLTLPARRASGATRGSRCAA